MNAIATGSATTISALDRLIAAASVVDASQRTSIEPTLAAERDAPGFGSLEAMVARSAVAFPLLEVVVRGQIVAGVA